MTDAERTLLLATANGVATLLQMVVGSRALAKQAIKDIEDGVKAVESPGDMWVIYRGPAFNEGFFLEWTCSWDTEWTASAHQAFKFMTKVEACAEACCIERRHEGVDLKIDLLSHHAPEDKKTKQAVDDERMISL